VADTAHGSVTASFNLLENWSQLELGYGAGVAGQTTHPHVAGRGRQLVLAICCVRVTYGTHSSGRADVTLGRTYPRPIVDHAEARQRILEHLPACAVAG